MAGLIILPNLRNQSQQICFMVTVGRLFNEKFLDHSFNEVLLTTVERFSLQKVIV